MLSSLNLLVREKYFSDRILLFGEALHKVHPLAGQGFNMTLRDLADLKKILEKKIELGLDIGNLDTLSEFTQEAKPRNLFYLLGIDFVKNFFSIKDKNFKYLRNTIVTNLNKSNMAKYFFLNTVIR